MVHQCPKCHYQWTDQEKSTGRYSQNNAAWGYATQIANWFNDGTGAREVIEEGQERAGMEPRMNRFGRHAFKPWSKVTKEEASRVIEKLKEIARDMEIRLVEITE
jgi:DNA-directed RNA polymerase subunit F